MDTSHQRKNISQQLPKQPKENNDVDKQMQLINEEDHEIEQLQSSDKIEQYSENNNLSSNIGSNNKNDFFNNDDDDMGGLLSDDSDLLFVEDAESVDLHTDIEIKEGDFIYKFKIIQVKGRNTYLAEDMRRNNEQIIIKVFDNYYLKKDDNIGFHKKNNEIYLHSICESKHIVQFYEYFQTEAITAIVMEKCQKSLQDILDEQQKPFTLDETLNYLKQILVSISYLHRNHIIHNQLSLQYMLIGYDNIIKIGGFDQALKLNPEQNFLCDVKIQPYINENSPEIKLKKPFDIQSDMYSLGVMLYKMLQNKMPFNLDQMQKQMVNIFSSQPDFKHPDIETLEFEPNNGQQLPNYIQKLIQSMLNPDPEMRITWKELYELLNDILQSNLNDIKVKDRKKTLSCSKSSQLLRESKVSLESEMERSFQNSLKNQFYLFTQGDSYGNKKIKKENSDMKKIFKNSKQTQYEVWELDYIEFYQAYINNSSSNALKEESNEQAQFNYEASLKDQGINCYKIFHQEKDYLKEIENIQKLQNSKKSNINNINISPYISRIWNLQKQNKSYKYQNGLCNLQEFSDYRMEKFIPWQPQELIYLFKILLSSIIGFYQNNLFHSRLNLQNIFLDYNQKNGRILLKVKNFQYLTENYKQKQQFSHYIFENDILENETSQNTPKKSQIETFNSKEDRLHSEILDIVCIFTELSLKSYFNKPNLPHPPKPQQNQSNNNNKGNNIQQSGKDAENNSHNTGSNSSPQENNLLFAYALQEKIFKYARENNLNQKQKLSYYLTQIKTRIFKEFCIPKKPNPNNIHLPTEFQDGMSQSLAQNNSQQQQFQKQKTNNSNDNKNFSSSLGSSSQEGQEQKLNASYQPKFPFSKPKAKKSQFSTSNINEVFYSDDDENGTLNGNNNNGCEDKAVLEEENENENDNENDSNQEDRMKNSIKENNHHLQNNNDDDNNNINCSEQELDEKELQAKLEELDIMHIQNNQQEEEEENNEHFHYAFSHLVDTIQQILVPQLYTPAGLVQFLQRKDIFNENDYKQIYDNERVIDEILKEKLDLNSNFERFGSKSELDAKNDFRQYN